jgi:selenide,water dikinase
VALGRNDAVHALTDVTGFGLLGHLLEICRASGTGARVRTDRVPVLSGARELAAEGVITGASGRNWSSYGGDVALASDVGDVERALLTDPQTSGGLLVACAPQAAGEVLELFLREGFEGVSAIGEIVPGPPRVEVAAA